MLMDGPHLANCPGHQFRNCEQTTRVSCCERMSPQMLNCQHKHEHLLRIFPNQILTGITCTSRSSPPPSSSSSLNSSSSTRASRIDPSPAINSTLARVFSVCRCLCPRIFGATSGLQNISHIRCHKQKLYDQREPILCGSNMILI